MLCILFMFIDIKFIYYHFYLIFIIKSMNIYNDYMNYVESENETMILINENKT